MRSVRRPSAQHTPSSTLALTSTISHGRSSPTTVQEDDSFHDRVREGLRMVGSDVQLLIDQHQAEVKQLSQQIENLKSQAILTENAVELPGLPSKPDPDKTAVAQEPPGIPGQFFVSEAQEESRTGEMPSCKSSEPHSAKARIAPPPGDKRAHREDFHNKLMGVLDSPPPAKLEGGRSGHRPSVVSVDSDQQMQTLLPDVEAMKERVRDAITQPEYNVANYYYETGICPLIATHPWFEPVTLLVIAFNAIWAAVDLDFNDAPMLSDAHPVFQVAENAFCTFFVIEWTVRFLSFRKKRDCLRDAWFVFDTILAFTFAFETWLLTILTLIVDFGGRQAFGNASILRLFRLIRLNRMGRLVRIVRALPEMLIVIKGIGIAVRSVFFTLCLLTVILYVFGIGFRTLSAGTRLESTLFPSVPAAMLSLLLGGVLPEYEDTVREIGGVNLLTGLLFGSFMFITTITLMNFLIGVLVEAVSAVAVTEKEALTVKFVKTRMLELLEDSGIDKDGNKQLSRSEFEDLLLSPKTASAMQHMGVDVVGLVEFGEVLFDDDDELPFADIIRLVLQLRGTNPTTVKDIVDLRKFMLQELSAMTDYLVQVFEECLPKLNVASAKRGSESYSRTRGTSALGKMLAT